MNSHLSRIYITIYLKPPIQEDDEQSYPSLLGVAPDGVYTVPACHHASGELLPRLFILTQNGRLFSVALSLRLPSLAVNQHHCSMEPGLSSRSSLRKSTSDYPIYSILYITIFS